MAAASEDATAVAGLAPCELWLCAASSAGTAPERASDGCWSMTAAGFCIDCIGSPVNASHDLHASKSDSRTPVGASQGSNAEAPRQHSRAVIIRQKTALCGLSFEFELRELLT